MKLQRIYSSKLYVTSTRKDKIHAAVQDPFNQELVQQLSEYLDDEGTVELEQAIAEQKPNDAETPDTSSGADTSAGGSSDFGGGSGGASTNYTGNIMDDFGTDDLADVEPIVDEGGESAEPAEPAESPVEETSAVSGKSVMATSIIWSTFDDVVNDSETIKGTLNSREDTKGVNRLQVKDNELWIYFNDDENLNDKMVDVIELLNATGYTYLTFSRLARSNNAMVFDISLTAAPVKSIQEVEEEIKDAK